MIGYLNLFLRLAIWFLLTDNFGLTNLILGVCIALLLPPRTSIAPGTLKDWLRVFWEAIVALPQAFLEAFELIFRPHNEEDIVMERVKPQRSAGLVFLDIFIITFTPKTIVVKYHEEGWYEVHRVVRRKKALKDSTEG